MANKTGPQSSVELWNGAAWVPATAGATATATFGLGSGAAAVTLVPVSDIAAGTYSRIQLTIQDGQLDLALTVNGRQLATSVPVGAQGPLVIEKDVQVTVNPDGSRTIQVAIAAGDPGQQRSVNGQCRWSKHCGPTVSPRARSPGDAAAVRNAAW